ncbi:hypothetical protein BpHYR1_028674 [Brachionus plicatilis]|uniref:Uncharacterized protein n=1 Tax=Brachionus plicatilis TaxID=10195 RepID=A0A3M7TAR3_BRAPC|nr:hypothetical protein BpHYR1_028674 [Brachionus plicatilis]
MFNSDLKIVDLQKNVEIESYLKCEIREFQNLQHLLNKIKIHYEKYAYYCTMKFWKMNKVLLATKKLNTTKK